MDRGTLSVIAALGALLNGGLYIVLVFIAALLMHRAGAAELAIAAAGFVYLNCAADLALRRQLAAFFSLVAIVCAVAAGLALLR